MKKTNLKNSIFQNLIIIGVLLSCNSYPAPENFTESSTGETTGQLKDFGIYQTSDSETGTSPNDTYELSEFNCPSFESIQNPYFKWSQVFGNRSSIRPGPIIALENGVAYTASFKGLNNSWNGFDSFNTFITYKNSNTSWTRNLGCEGDQGILSITEDTDNNIIVFGIFDGLIGFSEDDFYWSTSNFGFLAKFHYENGATIWHKIFDGNFNDISNYIKTDNNNNIIIFASFLDFASIDQNNFYGSDGELFAKFSSKGDLEWVNFLTESENFNSFNLPLLDSDGNFYLTSHISPKNPGDALSINNIPIWKVESEEQIPETVVFQFSTEGELVGKLKINEEGKHLSVKKTLKDENGFVFIGSPGGDLIDLGDGPILENSEDEVFILKLDDHGKSKWGTTIPGIRYDSWSFADIGPNNNVYIGGNDLYNPDSPIDLGDGPITNYEPTETFSWLSSYDSDSGKRLWSTHFGSSPFQETYHLDANDKKIWISGDFLGHLKIQNKISEQSGMLLASFDENGNIDNIDNVGDLGYIQGSEVSIAENNDIIISSQHDGSFYINENELTIKNEDSKTINSALFRLSSNKELIKSKSISKIDIHDISFFENQIIIVGTVFEGNSLGFSKLNSNSWFIASLDEDLEIQWEYTFERGGGRLQVTNNSNSIFVSGNTDNKDLDINGNIISGPCFLIKLNKYGNIIFSKNIKGSNSTLRISANEQNVIVNANPLTKFDSDGNVEWDLDKNFNVINIDEYGNIFLGLIFEGKIEFEDFLKTSNDEDSLIIKLQPDSKLSWAWPIGGIGDQKIKGINIFDNEKIVVIVEDKYQLKIIQYSKYLSWLWSEEFGDIAYSYIDYDQKGNNIVFVTEGERIDFGKGPLPLNDDNGFVAKFSF